MLAGGLPYNAITIKTGVHMAKFGTDGIRGRFGDYPITPDAVMKLGFAAGRVLSSSGTKSSVLIGKDTRLSGYVLESALQSGFNAAGVDVYMLGPIPTPAIAHLTRSFHADAGVVISASHNPFFDNGIKFFSSQGAKLSDEVQAAIERALDDPFEIREPEQAGKSFRVDDAKGRYVEFCKSTFPYRSSLKGLKIVIDCANGAGYSVAPRTLKELGATVIAIHNSPNGRNINENCGSTHPESLQAAVLANKADLGMALDGDGDRIQLVDETGALIDGDHMLYILATQGETKATGVVGTLMSNAALELALEQSGIELVRAKVGDRYVMSELTSRGWMLGGEPSGHILTLDKSTTGDAMIAGLQVLALMVQTGKALSELASGLKLMPQTLINVRADKRTLQNAAVSQQIKEIEAKLVGQGRLLVRPSGTEPVVRVMVECVDAKQGQELAESLAEVIEHSV